MTPRATTLGLAVASLASAALAQSPVLTEVCTGPPIGNQTFTASCGGPGGSCTFTNSRGCISSDGTAALSNVIVAPCDSSDQKQQWVYTPSTGSVQQMPLSNGMCFNVDGGPNEPAGTGIILYNCGARRPSSALRAGGLGSRNANDVFTLDFPNPGQIFSNSSGDSGQGLCLDLTPPPPPPPPPFHWFYLPGQLGGADALPPATMTLDAAEAACMAEPTCDGISYQGPLNPAAPQSIIFKSSTVPNAAPGWVTLLRCGVQTPC